MKRFLLENGKRVKPPPPPPPPQPEPGKKCFRNVSLYDNPLRCFCTRFLNGIDQSTPLDLCLATNAWTYTIEKDHRVGSGPQRRARLRSTRQFIFHTVGAVINRWKIETRERRRPAALRDILYLLSSCFCMLLTFFLSSGRQNSTQAPQHFFLFFFFQRIYKSALAATAAAAAAAKEHQHSAANPRTETRREKSLRSVLPPSTWMMEGEKAVEPLTTPRPSRNIAVRYIPPSNTAEEYL